MICDADKRFNVNQIIEHNWLVKVVPNSEKVLEDFNQDNLKKYIEGPKLKKDILMSIVNYLGDSDIQLLKEIFTEMDVNKDGTLTLQEFKDGLMKVTNEDTVSKAEEFFNEFDLNSDGRFDYNDFIINSLDRHLLFMEDKLFMAFWIMNRDGSGKLSKEEIKQALGLDCDIPTMEKIISQYDLDRDGEIDYLEFLNLMLYPLPKEEEAETVKKKK